MQTIVENNEIVVCPTPNLYDAFQISHKQLIRILRHCPFSPYFARSADQLNRRSLTKKLALQQVVRLICSTHMLSRMAVIDERQSLSEYSSKPDLQNLKNSVIRVERQLPEEQVRVANQNTLGSAAKPILESLSQQEVERPTLRIIEEENKEESKEESKEK